MNSISVFALAAFMIYTNHIATEPPHALDWWIVNDSVMGGVSTSQIVSKQNYLLFSGNLSLDNNGGFASARTLLDLTSQSELRQVTICFEGDGRTYKLRFRTNRGFDGIAYSVDFKTDTSETDKVLTERSTPQCLTFAAEQFRATFRGRLVSSAPTFSFNNVQQIGLMIADKTEGQFKLNVHSISFN